MCNVVRRVVDEVVRELADVITTSTEVPSVRVVCDVVGRWHDMKRRLNRYADTTNEVWEMQMRFAVAHPHVPPDRIVDAFFMGVGTILCRRVVDGIETNTDVATQRLIAVCSAYAATDDAVDDSSKSTTSRERTAREMLEHIDSMADDDAVFRDAARACVEMQLRSVRVQASDHTPMREHVELCLLKGAWTMLTCLFATDASGMEDRVATERVARCVRFGALVQLMDDLVDIDDDRRDGIHTSATRDPTFHAGGMLRVLRLVGALADADVLEIGAGACVMRAVDVHKSFITGCIPPAYACASCRVGWPAYRRCKAALVRAVQTRRFVIDRKKNYE